MTRKLFPLIALAAAAIAGCDSSDHTIVAGPEGEDPMANAVQNLENVELPPAIVASNAYRCRDNSLVYIDWLSNDTARVKKTKAEVGTTVAKGEGAEYTGEGQTISGSPTDQTITINGQSCKR